MNPDDIRAIAITDCGSTTTKAILIEKVDGEFRQTARGDAPTTVEEPALDVTQGVIAALDDISTMRGHRIVDGDGRILRPHRDAQGVDLYLSTSSAGGGLQMMVAGVVRRLSAESAERAALGAGAIVVDVISCDDERPLHAQIDRMRKLRPDMVLLAGGVDGGADIQVVEMAELLAAADPRPRFGADFRLPVVFAGNREVRDQVRQALESRCELFTVDNLRRTIDEERLGPARERIHDLFLDHVMRQAPGFGRLVEWTDAPVMPTPSAVGEILSREAQRTGESILCVDIGGATTDIFSVVRGVFNRTVSANLGLSYSATNVLVEAGLDNVARWLPFEIDTSDLVDLVMNKTIRPTTIPDSIQELLVEQAIAREALGLSFDHHRAFATAPRGGREGANIDSAFEPCQEPDGLRPIELGLMIGSGGVISHAPRPAQAAAMLIDGFLPEGVTRLAKDSIFMMPHLGVLSRIMPEAARSVFERDCIEDLGTCVAPVGSTRQGETCLRYELSERGKPKVTGELLFGELKTIPLETGAEGLLELGPTRRFDVGNGPGKAWSGEVRGGPAGLILDGRGRPIAWPEARSERIEAVGRWLRALSAVPESAEGA